MKIQIKTRYTNTVLFECDAPEGLESWLHARHALEKAVSARANLAGAYLVGANLAFGASLCGERPIFQIGPIGSRCAYFVAYMTNSGVRLRAGCFFGTIEEFESKLKDTHGDSNHAKEYRAALELIRIHSAIWAPTGDQ